MRWLQSILSFPCLDSLRTTRGINRHFRPVALHNDFCSVDVPGCAPHPPSLLHTPKQKESRGLAPRQNELKMVHFFKCCILLHEVTYLKMNGFLFLPRHPRETPILDSSYLCLPPDSELANEGKYTDHYI